MNGVMDICLQYKTEKYDSQLPKQNYCCMQVDSEISQ